MVLKLVNCHRNSEDWRSGKTIWLVDAAGPDQVVQRLIESVGGDVAVEFPTESKGVLEPVSGSNKVVVAENDTPEHSLL